MEIRSGLHATYEGKQAAALEKEQLSKTHNLRVESVLVIEKKGMSKFFSLLIDVTLTVLVVILAFVGVLALCVPDLRADLFEFINSNTNGLINKIMELKPIGLAGFEFSKK